MERRLRNCLVIRKTNLIRLMQNDVPLKIFFSYGWTQVLPNQTMIMSSDYIEHIVPLIHDVSQLNSIYVLCENTVAHELWIIDWWKMKGIFTGIDIICESLEQATRQCDQNSMLVSLISESDIENRNHDQLDQSFMYTQILKEILFEIKYNKESIEDLATYCYEQ